MTSFTFGPERIDALVELVEPRFRRRFLSVVQQIRDRFTLLELERLLTAGQIGEALRFAEVSAVRLGNVFGEAVIIAGDETALFIENSLLIPVSFDRVNQRAIDAMQQNQLRLVREFSLEQRQSTRTAMNAGVARGANPRTIAREVRDSIGLTSRQVQIVENYRRSLETLSRDALQRKLRDARFDPTVRRAITTSEPLAQAQIDRMVGRYRERWLSFRATTIARTESLRAVSAGNQEMFIQAVEEGQINAKDLQRQWNTALDERVRSSHGSMHGQLRALDEPFISGKGARLRFPSDPNAPADETIQCRCAVGTTFTDSAVEDLQVGTIEVVA